MDDFRHVHTNTNAPNEMGMRFCDWRISRNEMARITKACKGGERRYIQAGYQMRHDVVQIDWFYQDSWVGIRDWSRGHVH